MITSACGHHCGIDRGFEGHCGCPECRCPQALPAGKLKPEAYERITGKPYREAPNR